MSTCRSAAAGVAALLTTACHAPLTFPDSPLVVVNSDSGALHVEVRAVEQPPQVGVTTFEYTVTDALGAPVDNLELTVSPWMPEHGHGPTVQPTVVALADGHYEIDDVDLIMSAHWALRTLFTPPDDAAAPEFDVP